MGILAYAFKRGRVGYMLDYAYENEFYYQVPDKSDLKSEARRFWVRLAETFT